MKTPQLVRVDGQVVNGSPHSREARAERPLAGSPLDRRQDAPRATLPTTRNLTLAYALSSVVVALVALVSGAGILLAPTGLYGIDPKVAAGVTPSTAGILVPGFLAHDALNLVVGLPILLGSLWLARRGSLFGLLLWPGALFYVLYTYTTYLVGAPFSVLFLLSSHW